MTEGADSSPAPTDTSTTAASPTPESTPEAVTPPSDTGQPQTEPDLEPTGPLPLERHKAILENARKKAAEEALQPYAWVQKYGDPQTAQQRLAVTEWMERDPAGFLRTWAASQNLDLSQVVPHASAPTPPRVEEPPQPDILLESGQMTYSTERLRELLAYQERQLASRFERELAPIKQERAITQVQQEATLKARQEIAAAQSWTGFAEHRADIVAHLQHNPTATLRDAYIAVVPAKLAEREAKVRDEAYQKALADIQSKAAAGSSVTPRTSGTGSTEPPAGMSIRDAIEFYATSGR